MSDEEILLGEIPPIASTPCTAEIIEGQIRTEPSTTNIFSVYRHANTPWLCVLLISVICAVVAGAAMPLVTIVFGALAREFINGDENTPDDVRHWVQHLTLLLVYIAIGSFVATMISTWGLNVVGEHITRRLQRRYLSSVLQQNMAYFDVVGTGELTSRIDQDMKLIQTGISQKLGNIISGVSGFVVAIICAFIQNRRFASIMISQPVAMILLVGLMGFWLSVTQQRGLPHSLKLENLAQEVLNAMRSVIAYRSQERYAKKYHDTLLQPGALEFRERLIFGVIVAGSFTILHWANGLGFWQADRLFRQGYCTVSEALSILYATVVAGGMLCQALPYVVDVTKASQAANRVFSVIERVSPINSMADTGRIYGPVRGEICFDNVEFAYPSRPERTTLRDISFTVPAGHTVALVGPSGSGKSTVFGLLARLYNPIGGGIMLDNESIEEMNVAWLRSQIGYVSQDVTLFRASIHENIAHGLPNHTIKALGASAIRDLVIQAAKTAQIHSFIANLPDGYDTVIGSNGSSLSGGQRQRLAIARAIVSQPSVLLLDEATAALDSQSEKEIQEALSKAAYGRTTMIIAHRLSTVQNADAIIVMKDGQILNHGTHSELMITSALYRDLVEQQTLRQNDAVGHSLSPAKSIETKSSNVTVSHDAPKKPQDAPGLNPSPESSIKQVWLLNEPELPYVIAGIILSALAGMTYPVQAIFFGNGIISIISPGASTGGHNVHFWARLYLIHGIVVFLVYSVRGYCFAVSASQLHLRARSRLFKALLFKNLIFFEDKDHSAGAMVSFLSSGTPKITGVSGTSLGLVVESIVMLATGITVGCIFGWKLGVAAMATVPLIAMSSFLQYYIEAQVQKHVKRETNAVAIAHEAFSAIKTVTILNLQTTIIEAFQQESRQDRQSGYWVISAALHACTTSLRVLSIAFVFWYGGTRLIATGEYTIQQFFICFAATVWGSQSAATLFAHAPDIAGAHAAAARLAELLRPDNSPAQVPDKYQKHSYGSALVPNTAEDLALQHITFRYPSRPTQLTLNDTTFNARSGSFIALVGSTGSGKSSVINLIERFYVAESGQITLGHNPIERYDLNNYRGYLALVDQNPCLVGEDLRDCLQSDERIISDEKILIALKDVGLADFVLSLPQGLSTPVMANGSTLSGGQRQRMAIAKALLWRPKIFLLDEATSALDRVSEALVQEALQRAKKGRTVIAIAHRLKTIVDADEILVLDHGRIIERGRHEELMTLRGKYWQMARLQQFHGEVGR
ncbi:P-loop containing nucleoside triphosphate hydrolase protein [Aspergillus novoparasiticus]|uniref:P-loop containing nucleoside triphosphate hydrolase protein n=1 Tax=Aspergillus novoparasiticus TaxID=986946 RepID=A0A5N6EL66_9EURO|nr:P-loop containing nucleoside triphosphate hydrolase protein [Aspergillus novoparasiticus]